MIYIPNYITDIRYLEDFADILYNITCVQDKYIYSKGYRHLGFLKKLK